jgi:ATP-dependent DNA helicase RecG
MPVTTIRLTAPPKLDDPLKVVGITPANVALLSKLDIVTVRDLLLALPYDWEAYGEPTPVDRLRPGVPATVVGVIQSIKTRRPFRNRTGLKTITEAVLHDDSDEGLRLTWFNQNFVGKALTAGARVAVAGMVKEGRYGGVQMSSPHFELLDALGEEGPKAIGGLMPKYHLVKGLTSKKIAQWVSAAMPAAEALEDVLPAEVRERHRLLPIAEAVRLGHQPETDAEWKEARRRMAFMELFELQAAFALMRARQSTEPAAPIPYDQRVIDTFKAGVGFELTRAQRRSTWDAFQDMARTVPMNRLLNGDVGSGKTAVAAACVAMAHAAGMQSVVMAPTEILARQHLVKFRAYLEESFPDLKVELLVSGQNAAERRRVRTAAASGHCALVVGTHALIEDDVELADLGLAVVDEQHRFGTRQRELLRAKGKGRPHFLAMTATPIPRTLALAVYGEMSVSVMDELPPGRTPVTTQVVPPDQRSRAYDLVREQVGQGRQAFVIYPLIEESEKTAAKAATVEFERLRTEVFPELAMGLVHGRLKDKDEVMKRFVAGEIQVLVATAVVEVGVDVPNASVMMIEGADRFGLAQLHQFRGRVGRGAAQSYCLLLADDPSAATLERLRLVTEITDGFKLAEEDMRLRGMGELLGQRQHGMSDLAMQGLREPELLNEVRQEAERLLAEDPDLKRHPVLAASITRRLQLTSIS